MFVINTEVELVKIWKSGKHTRGESEIESEKKGKREEEIRGARGPEKEC